jgi:3-deoxy-D-manno-octulosonate 8-phosphate phosphatase (KDO 8-P phosphatase)
VAYRDIEVAKPIRMLLCDVDGVLTDGSIIIDNAGIESKAFHVRDGLAIKLWQRCGFQFGLVTSRNSQIVKLRAAELSIDIVRQGCLDKLPVVRELCEQTGIQQAEVCYIGDDLPDIPVLNEVGLPVAVADAVEEARAVAKWTTELPGGRGAVRETIERLLKAKGLWAQFIPARPMG